MNNNFKVLFLHVPKFSSYYKPLDEFMNITYIPMGVFALADLVSKLNISVEIVHLGIEWILDHNFSIIQYIKNQKNIKVIYMPLFWHYQSYDVIQVASKIKNNFPDIFVILGGFTASYFADEIIEKFNFIDCIIKGYAEKPIVELTKLLINLENFEKNNINNNPILSFKNFIVSKKSKIYKYLIKNTNPSNLKLDDNLCEIYITDQKIFDSLRFSSLGLLKNHHYYVKLFSFPLAYSKNLSIKDNIKYNNMGLVMFPLEVGRGCTTSCSWCAGCNKNQYKMNYTYKIMWRDTNKVIETIKEALTFGYKTFAICFDPLPNSQEYYLELFDKIKQQNIKCGLYFECYSLPTFKFIKKFYETFDLNNSVIAISPECGNEEVRKKNKGFYFSNNEFFEILNLLASYKIKTDIFFTMGIPFENIKTLYDTKELIYKIHKTYKNIGRMMTWGIQVEPGSPLFEYPEQFNAITDRKCFLDFYKIHGGKSSDTYSVLGYSINNYFLDNKFYSPEEFSKKIMEIKCKDFCFLHNNSSKYNLPFFGRITCKLREFYFKLKGFGAKRFNNIPRPEFK